MPLLAQAPPQIPLVSGLTMVSALHYPEGDRENVVTVSQASSNGARYTWRYEHPRGTAGSSLPDRGEFHRFVRASDLAGAPRIDQIFMSSGAEESPGFTAFSFSNAVYTRLLSEKQIPFSMTDIQGGGSSLGAFGGVFQSRITVRGTLSLASPTPEPMPMPMLVNGQRVNLQTLHYTGHFAYQDQKSTSDFWVVVDSTHPLILRVVSGTDVLQTVRIDLPTKGTEIEKELVTSCRAELPGIYFAFNSTSLDPASDPALSEVSELLAKHADWKLAIEGHTDNIGGDASNQTLSTHRLSSAGFGAKRPREPNTSIEGRARNRRVELVRPCLR
ncbi:MAG: OmpA family protein [Gemmatimonadota bacterium]